MEKELVSFELKQDERKIRMCTKNDVEELTLDDAIDMHFRLKDVIDKLDGYEPPHPAPLFLKGHDCKESFAHGEYTTDHKYWWGYMGGSELRLENVDQIINWCQSVKEFLKDKEMRPEE